ncbi:hypothetical protein A3J91_03660 [Candidatus Peribacteria bacterium RIFOXYC2_FULL_58_10]|nr:MAG: hypothetical protein A3J91_03660 [Candidatus Peribacteria bacterium RIFOXYC2_FULL_58_10]OGJ85263.1 MAG: hypothetical protein A2529_02255 [Candidatus Peribacteria bacterium RIFOXYD2_FULL_58_15]
MPIDLNRLISLVKGSKLLMDDERKEWLAKMETMSEPQLKKLSDILERAEKVNWTQELPKYEAAVQATEGAVAQFESTLASPPSHA